MQGPLQEGRALRPSVAAAMQLRLDWTQRPWAGQHLDLGTMAHQDVVMGTTLALDPDVEQLVTEDPSKLHQFADELEDEAISMRLTR